MPAPGSDPLQHLHACRFNFLVGHQRDTPESQERHYHGEFSLFKHRRLRCRPETNLD